MCHPIDVEEFRFKVNELVRSGQPFTADSIHFPKMTLREKSTELSKYFSSGIGFLDYVCIVVGKYGIKFKVYIKIKDLYERWNKSSSYIYELYDEYVKTSSDQEMDADDDDLKDEGSMSYLEIRHMHQVLDSKGL